MRAKAAIGEYSSGITNLRMFISFLSVIEFEDLLWKRDSDVECAEENLRMVQFVAR